MGSYLTQVEDWDGATRLYERAMALHAADEPSAAVVVLQMQMGRLKGLLGKYEEAAHCFAKVETALADPEHHGLDRHLTDVLLGDVAATYAMMGETYLHAKRFPEASAAFQKADAAQPKPALLSYRLSRIALAQEKPAEALEKLQPYLDQHLTDEGLDPYETLADSLQALGRSSELLAKLETLHATDPQNVPLGYFLAERYHQAGQLDHAQRLFHALLERAPAALGYRSLVDIYRTNKQPERLLDVLGQMAEKTTTLDTLGVERTKALLSDSATVEALLATAHKRLQEHPEQLGLGPSLAVALLAHETKQYPVSAEFYERALAAQPERATVLRLGWGLALLGDEKYAEAAAVLRRGIETAGKKEEKAVFAYYLASALEMQGQTTAALEAARQAVQFDPDEARFHARVAWVYYHSKQYAEATLAYEALLKEFDSKYDPPETREAVREARLVLSNLAVIAQQLPEAERRLEEVLDEYPDDISAQNDLGYLWADANKNLWRAEPMLLAAVAAEPDNAAYHDSLGWLYYRQGRIAQAVAELEKAAQAESDPMIHDHLGDAYLAQGHPERARPAWQKALEGFKERQENDTLQKVQQKLQSH